MRQYKRFPQSLLACLMAVVLLISLIPAALAAEGDTQITILGTSDTHGNIWGYSYESMSESTADGLSRISTYVNQVREENPNTILVDNGDTIQGTIMTDDLYNKSAKDHPAPAAMNYMKYDAWTLGNHEFNWGVDNLKAVIEQSNAPVLSANIKNADGSYVTGNGYTIVERAGVKVAIIGVTTPNIPRWDGTKQGVAELKFEAMADAVNECIKDIGDKADVIMVCAHAGLEAEYSTDGSDASQTILDKCPEVDLLQMGHTHTTYVNDEKIPVGEVKNNAAQVVRYDLTLNADKEIIAAAVETVPMTDIAPDQALRDVTAVKAAQEKTVKFITENVLGHASAKFQPENEISGIPAGRIMDTAVMDLIATVQLENSGADVTGAALFKDTSDLPKGDLNYGNIFDIYKFPNVLYTVKITGAEMKAYMEWAAECYNTWQPGDVSISFNPAKAGYLHDHFSGVSYEINLSKPAGQRVENIIFKGEPLTDDTELTLCVNDYRFTGLKTAGIISGEKEWESSASVRDMLVQYLAEHDPLDPVVDNNWKITGVDLQLENAQRTALIEKVNSGALATPYNKSLNLDAANNVIVDGLLNDASILSVETASGIDFFRLRDLATALKGSAAAFNVEWNGQVTLTKGGEYTAAPLPVEDIPAAAMAPLAVAPLTVSVDGAAITVPVVLYLGNYYVSADGLNALIGTTAAATDGVMTIATN